MPELELLEPQAFTKADWEGLFRSLTADLDPWAFDLVELIARFRSYVAERNPAFAVPGRMVLASSILLRMKSDWVRNGGAPPTVEAAVEEVAAELANEEPTVYIAPELRLPLRRVPRGRVTVGDLGRALRAAVASERRRSSAKRDFSPEELGFDLEEETFTDRARNLLKVLLSLVNGKRVVPFRAVTGADPQDKVARLMELLHLDAQGEVRLSQEEFLGEILVEVLDGNQSTR
ncbi:MAG: hypothetical protein BIP78_0443 [Candidatus Bipolaricaulis sibiricus]|uniref:Segregation and condensation protein A n=1 Tax=Bipolaricaulis sibiricus TaxID=2501609 RepID=A0A410FSP0_BIPS1|nr:MAG: hypothetical protein BIP78_0443 [Candidatus Bipolaricaulis sibiricus]